MIYIPVTESHYQNAILEVREDCRDGTRVLAWVNYLKDLGIKRYYISEKFSGEWYFITVDVFPHDRTVWWDVCTQEAYERDHYIDSVYYSFEDDSVVIHIDNLSESGEV